MLKFPFGSNRKFWSIYLNIKNGLRLYLYFPWQNQTKTQTNKQNKQTKTLHQNLPNNALILLFCPETWAQGNEALKVESWADYVAPLIYCVSHNYTYKPLMLLKFFQEESQRWKERKRNQLPNRASHSLGGDLALWIQLPVWVILRSSDLFI